MSYYVQYAKTSRGMRNLSEATLALAHSIFRPHAIDMSAICYSADRAHTRQCKMSRCIE